jgi:hypothetical protein
VPNVPRNAGVTVRHHLAQDVAHALRSLSWRALLVTEQGHRRLQALPHRLLQPIGVAERLRCRQQLLRSNGVQLAIEHHLVRPGEKQTMVLHYLVHERVPMVLQYSRVEYSYTCSVDARYTYL